MTEKEKGFHFEITLWAIVLLYLIAILAGAVSVLLGIAGFVCVKVLLLVIMWLIDSGRKETTG